MLLSNFHPDLRLGWTAQLEQLNAFLGLAPEHPQAWRWRSRHKILTFLVARYGDAAMPDEQLPVASRRDWIFHQLLLPRHDGKAPRSRKSIGETLERIAAVNHEIPRTVHRSKARW